MSRETDCPVCGADLKFEEGTEQGELLSCAECGTELEVISLHAWYPLVCWYAAFCWRSVFTFFATRVFGGLIVGFIPFARMIWYMFSPSYPGSASTSFVLMCFSNSTTWDLSSLLWQVVVAPVIIPLFPVAIWSFFHVLRIYCLPCLFSNHSLPV